MLGVIDHVLQNLAEPRSMDGNDGKQRRPISPNHHSARVPGSEAPRQSPTGRSSGLRLVVAPEQPSPATAHHRSDVASGSGFWPITAAALRRIRTGFPLRRTRSHGRNLSRPRIYYFRRGRTARRMGPQNLHVNHADARRMLGVYYVRSIESFGVRHGYRVAPNTGVEILFRDSATRPFSPRRTNRARD
jgi:hypothetical protein